MKKVGAIVIALNLLGLGINFVLQAGFGCDAITMINDGLAKFLHVNYTIAGIVYNTIFIILAWLFAKRLLGWGSISYAYGTGIFIDLYQRIVEPLHITDASISMKLMVLVIGQLLVCFAFAMLIELDLGRSALDALLAKLEEKLTLSYRVLKTITDILLVLLAYMLGATFGIGTVLCVLSGGITIQAFCKLLEKKRDRRGMLEQSL